MTLITAEAVYHGELILAIKSFASIIISSVEFLIFTFLRFPFQSDWLMLLLS